jgi:membrane AbrB-like protein
MLGPMIACLIAALLRVPMASPAKIRPYVVIVLGVMLGGVFEPDIFDQAGTWLVSLSLLIPYTMLIAVSAIPYLVFTARYDPVTAYFSAMPGGLQEMVIVGQEMGGDEQRIALIHAARILLVVMSLPFMVEWMSGLAMGGRSGNDKALFGLTMLDGLALIACGVFGAWFGKVARLPAGNMLGPMIISGLAHVFGLTSADPPSMLVAAAQWVAGTGIGCRFLGMARRDIAEALGHGAAIVVIMLTVTVGLGVVVADWIDVSTTSFLLAFAPGGLAETGLIALALGIDVAYVALHHIVRITMIMTSAPLAFMGLRRLFPASFSPAPAGPTGSEQAPIKEPKNQH